MIKGFETTKYLLTQRHTIFFYCPSLKEWCKIFKAISTPSYIREDPSNCYEILPHSSLTECKDREEKYVHFTNAMNIKNRVAWAMWQEAIHGDRDPCAIEQSHWFSLPG